MQPTKIGFFSHDLARLDVVLMLQVNGNALGWAGGRALFRGVNSSEAARVIGIKECDFSEGGLDSFDPRFPGKCVSHVPATGGLYPKISHI